jgi:Flp pilus assembly protein TadB
MCIVEAAATCRPSSTAQARLSGVILGMLPIGFFGFLLLTSREQMLDAIGTPLGGAALGIGLTLEVLAFLWIRHLLEVR